MIVFNIFFCIFATVIALGFTIIIGSVYANNNEDIGDVSVNTTDLKTLQIKDELIFINTIDGTFYAVYKDTGIIKWSFKEDSVIKFPKSNDNKPYFLTDPRDGSLYVINPRDGLKKFPYSIPELVSASPSKSADGYLYTGDKHDEWIAIDLNNGFKLDTLTSETTSKITTPPVENVLFLGRTQYTISMFDTNTRKKRFNITYFDYSTHADSIDSSFSDHSQSSFSSSGSSSSTSSSSSSSQSSKSSNERSNYPYYHFSSSSEGLLMTLNKLNGEIIWQLRLDSPIVALYRYQNDQLYKINFAIFSIESLTSLAHESWQYKHLFSDTNVARDLMVKKTFTPTLYVGNYKNNVYAMPAFVISKHLNNIDGPKLIDGPLPSTATQSTPAIEAPPSVTTNSTNNNNDTHKQPADTTGDETLNTNASANASIIGHHRLPSSYSSGYIKSDIGIVVPDKTNEYLKYYFPNKNQKTLCPADSTINNNNINSSSYNAYILKKISQYKYAVGVIVTAALVLLPIIVKKCFIDRRRSKKSKFNSKSRSSRYDSDDNDSESYDDEPKRSNRSNKSASGSNRHKVRGSGSGGGDVETLHSTMSVPDIVNGLVRVGKILYDPKKLLGRGCEGTIVYQGFFENRPVAVKRLLPECYTLADREADLLRDADQHSNVLRYFCMETDNQFRFIALELCQATLNDYVQRIDEFSTKIKPLTVLQQATSGLAHLHSLDIVHRDVKPHNVLLSFPNKHGEVIAMISDFGMCKRLEYGNQSFSKRSGITGTDGWIAPEILEDLENKEDNKESCVKRITKAIDIFSLGCVYYYVLTYGQHPFGDSIRRQANILNYIYKLDKLPQARSEYYTQKVLIEKMISNDPKKRPNAKELLLHPIFWSKAKILQFLQDVSDRIEKIEPDDPIVLNLERNANAVLHNNWRVHICSELQNDLRKFRSYNGTSVRDLLRAIRNKKHHYRELTDIVKQSLGELPDGFTEYFTSRFPKLVLHTYEAMQCCQDEPMLDVYYKHQN